MNKETKSSTNYIMDDSDSSLEDVEIDLFDLIRTLIKAWRTIVCITFVCVGISVVYAIYAPKFYEAATLLAPADESKNSTFSSTISQFGGLAAMAGIEIPSNSNVERVLATLTTREFLKKFINSKNLLPIIFDDFWDKASSSWILKDGKTAFIDIDGVRKLKTAIQFEIDKSGLITVTFIWKDPQVAAQLLNDLVKQINLQLRENAIADTKKRIGYLEQELAKTSLQDMRAVLYNLLESEKQKAMLANVNEDFALEVIDPAVAPQNPSGASGKLFVAFGGVSGCFLGIIVVFLGQFFKKLKSSTPFGK